MLLTLVLKLATVWARKTVRKKISPDRTKSNKGRQTKLSHAKEEKVTSVLIVNSKDEF